MNIFQVFLESGFVAQIIMIILVFSSISSWAIFFKKLHDLKSIRRMNQNFFTSYQIIKNSEEIEKQLYLLDKSSYGKILKSGLEEFKTLKTSSNPKKVELADNIKLAMERTKISEIENLENSLPVLGTIVATAPFLGLLGTVWGIMEAFLEIRARGSAHITVVAPGISDALITTVYGLLVAIPALVFNNSLRSRIIKLDSELDKFISEAFANLKKKLVESEEK
ncbi:MAG: MotA/TolQ/ExbB proton channel family protein [candidate division WOR-3 bacterium]